MESNASEPRRAPLSHQIEVLARLGELPDLLTREEVMRLWHGAKWYSWRNAAARADVILLDRAIQSGALACEIDPEREEVLQPPPNGWPAPFTGFGSGEWDIDSVDRDRDAEYRARWAVRKRTIAAAQWIHRNAMRAWLAQPLAPRLADDSLLRLWWADPATWSKAGKPKRLAASDVLPELEAWKAANPGSTYGDAERAMAEKYNLKADAVQRARTRKGSAQRDQAASALRAAGAKACKGQRTQH
ncbi:hypothetical protein [Sinimarinibacterium flocculans]|uniref:hypothetical protein n=1 Tax=Sinimarinibacterium flocculans TaxID=985250 RepID=UPI003513FB41